MATLGNASSGFIEEINFEEFLLRAERLHDDYHRLLAGEHISGPAASRYKDQVGRAPQFAGKTVSTNAQVNTALANPSLQIHHGALLTCVWRPETALCQDGTGTCRPAWSRCRLTCQNIAYTDRDITELHRHADGLEHDLAAPGLPGPLRQRIQERLGEHRQAIARHHAQPAASDQGLAS